MGKTKLIGKVLVDSMKLLHTVTFVLEQAGILYILGGGKEKACNAFRLRQPFLKSIPPSPVAHFYIQENDGNKA